MDAAREPVGSASALGRSGAGSGGSGVELGNASLERYIGLEGGCGARTRSLVALAEFCEMFFTVALRLDLCSAACRCLRPLLLFDAAALRCGILVLCLWAYNHILASPSSTFHL
jgi:hypothetical protein